MPRRSSGSVKDYPLGSTQRVVLALLAKRQKGPTDVTWPLLTMVEICLRMRQHRSTVRESVERLLERGLILKSYVAGGEAAFRLTLGGVAVCIEMGCLPKDTRPAGVT